MVIVFINMVLMVKIFVCVVFMVFWFVCMVKYFGRVLIDVVFLVRFEYVERIEDLREVVREVVEEWFCMRWVMVRIIGRRYGEKKVSRICGNNERYGCRGMVFDSWEGDGGE